jgi:hypothetical protein
MNNSLVRSVLVSAALAGVVRDAPGGQTDTSAILQFERAADTYAFTHRQDDRRGAKPARLVEGQFFTPVVAAVFRQRIKRVSGCNTPARGEGGAIVPAVNTPVAGAVLLPACLTSALPHLPDELEYRAAGAALILADAHRGIVVDVLHGAFP